MPERERGAAVVLRLLRLPRLAAEIAAGVLRIAGRADAAAMGGARRDVPNDVPTVAGECGMAGSR